MKKSLLCVISVLWWMCLALCCISSSVLEVGTNETLYYELQTRAGVLETAGVSEEDLWRLDERLALCLEGMENWNDDWGWNGAGKPLRVVVDGAEQDAFNAREIAHMEDCQRLFDLLRTARWIFLVAFILLWVTQIVMERRTKDGGFLVWMWIGSLILIVPLAIFGIWAVIDFSSAFSFFHRLLFTNDLWLLDPATDLLIRICPSGMFESMGLRIALRAAAVLLGIPAVLTILKRISDTRKRKAT